MLDRTFSALADPTRRAILARLAEIDGLTVGAAAQPFAVSLPAVIKHLDVLTNAGLISRTRTGRTVTCRFTAAPMSEAMAWLERNMRLRDARLDALAIVLAEERKADGDQECVGRDRGEGAR